jgi:hypothetical protein
MITSQRTIRTLRPRKLRAIEIAMLRYKQYGMTKFVEDYDEYTLTGILISMPDLFIMAKIIDLAPDEAKEQEPAWFIRMAVGSTRTIADALPWTALPKICFCRRNDGRLRSYSSRRITELAKRGVK